MLGRCTPPSGLVLCSVYTTLFFGRVGSPYIEEMKTMEQLTLTLHKTKDTKNKPDPEGPRAVGCPT